MTFMRWSDEFRVGLDEVDDQHRWLFDATNRLHAEMSKEAKDRSLIGAIIEGLMDYTMNHFIAEEELFERHGYPHAQTHKMQHDKFTASVLNTLTDFENGLEIGTEVLVLLKDWLVQHIMKTDTAYVPYVRDQGHASQGALRSA